MGLGIDVLGEWPARRTSAIRLLELAEWLDTNEQMFCDVKGDNFGWFEDGSAGIIDVDALFSKHELGRILQVCCETSYVIQFFLAGGRKVHVGTTIVQLYRCIELVENGS